MMDRFFLAVKIAELSRGEINAQQMSDAMDEYDKYVQANFALFVKALDPHFVQEMTHKELVERYYDDLNKPKDENKVLSPEEMSSMFVDVNVTESLDSYWHRTMEEWRVTVFDDERDKVIPAIRRRIEAEQRKHSGTNVDWTLLAAIKIYGTFIRDKRVEDRFRNFIRAYHLTAKWDAFLEGRIVLTPEEMKIVDELTVSREKADEVFELSANEEKQRFEFDAILKDRPGFTVAYSEVDGKAMRAWVVVQKAMDNAGKRRKLAEDVCIKVGDKEYNVVFPTVPDNEKEK